MPPRAEGHDFRAYLKRHRDEFMDLLRLWDEDADGHISRKEFRMAWGALVVNLGSEHESELGRKVLREEIDDLYDVADIDETGNIPMEDLASALANLPDDEEGGEEDSEAGSETPHVELPLIRSRSTDTVHVSPAMGGRRAGAAAVQTPTRNNLPLLPGNCSSGSQAFRSPGFRRPGAASAAGSEASFATGVSTRSYKDLSPEQRKERRLERERNLKERLAKGVRPSVVAVVWWRCVG